MAQATKWNPEVQERMCSLAREGRHDIHICRLVGVSDQTLDVWLKKGAEDDAVEPWLGFARAYREAQAEGEIALLERLSLMAQDSQEPHDGTSQAALEPEPGPADKVSGIYSE